MKKDKVLWTTVLVVSVILLVGYSLWGFTLLNNGKYSFDGTGNYGRGMMGRWFNTNGSQFDSGKKLSVNQIQTVVNDYIKGYGGNLEVADIFVYKDTDYYVSIEENDTGKGAMELLVNPYTGQVYPEYGPNMMWNEKYGMHGGYGMMGNGRWNMMEGTARYNYDNYNDNRISSKRISMDQAVKIADEYVKDNLGKEFSVTDDGHEFYGYYTFHINEGNNTVGMMSINYYTGDVWYHDWHGELEQVISDNKE